MSGGVSVTAITYGGAGGYGYDGAKGGKGGDATLVDSVSGATSGALSLNQTAYAGAGGYSATSAAGDGGHAQISYSVLNSVASALTGSATAQGGTGGAPGASGTGGLGGLAKISQNLSSTRTGAVVTSNAYATGGQGGTGANGGAAQSQATATAVNQANATANATGGGGVVTGAALAQATTYTSAAAGQSYSQANANSAKGAADAQANSHVVGTGLATSIANATGLSGQSVAISQATGDLQRTVTAQANAQVGSVANSITHASFGGVTVGGLPNLSTSTNGYEAFANVDGTPNASSVTSLLNSHANVKNVINTSGLNVIGYGEVGANFGQDAVGPHTYSASTEFTFTLASSSNLVLGLLDFTGRDAGGAVDFKLDVSNFGASLLSQSFTSIASAESYFTDHALSLGLFNGNVDLKVSWTIAADKAQGGDFNFLVASGTLTNAIPEPGSIPMMLVGLGVLGMWTRMKAQRRA